MFCDNVMCTQFGLTQYNALTHQGIMYSVTPRHKIGCVCINDTITTQAVYCPAMPKSMIFIDIFSVQVIIHYDSELVSKVCLFFLNPVTNVEHEQIYIRSDPFLTYNTIV